MDESGSPDVVEPSPVATTPDATTTPEVTTTSSSESTTSTQEPDDHTTTPSSDSTTTTPSTSSSSSDEPTPDDKFICAGDFEGGITGLENHKGYKLTKFNCLIPKPEDAVGAPIFSVKNGETDVKCTATESEVKGIYNVVVPKGIEVLTNHLTVTSNWSDVINATELYLGCRLGKTYYTRDETVTGAENKCPEPLNSEIFFNGTCKRHDEFSVMGTEAEYEFVFSESSDICECKPSIEIKGNTIELSTEHLNFGNRTNLPCKGIGEETEIMCSVSGWVSLTSDEISSCTLDNGASSAVLSKLVFVLIVLISLTIL